jgi:hypothetical protein
MTINVRRITAGLSIAALLAAAALPAQAQTTEAKEKPRIYTYVANWVVPRARWNDWEKSAGANDKTFDQDLASGTLLAYGSDSAVVHEADASTHSGWWAGKSLADVLGVLDQFPKSAAADALLASSTKHWDDIYVSRHYGWRPGPIKGGYVYASSYKLKPDAPNDAVARLSNSFIVPLFEKLMADGSVSAYQVAVQAVHSQDPNLFFIFYITPNAAGLDKVSAALREALAANPLAGDAFGGMVDFSVHRDEIGRETAMFK